MNELTRLLLPNPTQTGSISTPIPDNSTLPGDTQAQQASVLDPNAHLAPILSQKVAAYVRVSLLGKVNGKMVIDQFDGVNGYHIRTMAAYLQYSNPVKITTGAGLLAVVDRYGDRDLVRITNPRCNAPDDAFDSQAFPNTGYAWGAIQDSCKIDMLDQLRETGIGNPQVQELLITPRGYLVLLCTNPVCVVSCLLSLDTLHQQNTGVNLITASEFRSFTLPAPFNEVTWSGAPTVYAQQNFDQVYYAVCPVMNGIRSIDPDPNQTGQAGNHDDEDTWSNNSALLFVDYITGNVKWMMPGPKTGPNGRILGGLINGETTTLLTSGNEDQDPRDASTITRNQFIEKSYCGCGAQGPYSTPDPQEVQIDTTFHSLDEVTTGLGMDTLNRGPHGNVYAPTEENFGTPSPGRQLDAGSTTFTMNPGLTSFTLQKFSNSALASSNPSLLGKVATVPAGQRIRRSHGLENTLVYTRHQPDQGKGVADPTTPLYYALHGTHFDYLSDGGHVYGCNTSYGSDVAKGATTMATDLMQPHDVSVDRSTENGSLKSPPDLKVALVDMKTGLYLPMPITKSLGYNLIGGIGAGLIGCSLATINNADGSTSSGFVPIYPTACTVVYWQENAAVDGVYATIGSLTDTNYQYNNALNSIHGTIYSTVDAVRRAAWVQLVNGYYVTATPQHGDPGVFPIYGDIPVGDSIEPNFTGTPPTVKLSMVPQTEDLKIPQYAPWAIYEPAVIPNAQTRAIPTQWIYSNFGINASTLKSGDGGGFDLTDAESYAPNWLPDSQFLQKPLSLSNFSSTFMFPYQDPAQSFNQPNTRVVDGLAGTITKGPTIFETAADGGFFYLNWKQDEVVTPNGDGTNTITYVVPDSTLNAVCGPVDMTPHSDTPEVVTGASPVLPGYLQVLPGTGANPNLNRAVGFDTNIRSWLGIFCELQREFNPFSDGVAAWSPPIAYENKLGWNVGHSIYIPVSYSIICANNYVPGVNAPNGNGATQGSSYDFGDEAKAGAGGVWEIDIFVQMEGGNSTPFSDSPTSTAFPMNIVTFQEQIDNLCPSGYSQIFDKLFAQQAGTPGDWIAGFNTDDPGIYTEAFCAYSSELIRSVTVRARLINYAFDVYRVGYQTVNYTAPATVNYQSFCPSSDPGYYVQNNCEAACCGNVMCISQVLFGNKLFSDDTIYHRKVSLLWEGESTYSFTEDPYRDAGIAMGRLMFMSVSMNILGPMSNWAINLRTAPAE